MSSCRSFPMKRRLVIAPILALGLAGCHAQPSPKKAALRPVASNQLVIEHVRVFDGQRVIAETDVVIDGDRIAGIGPDAARDDRARVIDGSGHTLLPGLIDAHTHVDRAEQLQQALAFGITTELDMAGGGRLAAAQRAKPPGDQATLYSAGNPVTVPGGHGSDLPAAPTVAADGDMAAFVAARFEEGSDYLKIILESGTGWGVSVPTLSPAMMAAAVAAAHQHDRLAVVHITTSAEAAIAVSARADALVHVYMGGANPALSAKVRRAGTAVIPTLSVLVGVCGARRGDVLAAHPTVAPYLGQAARAALADMFPLDDPPACDQFLHAVAQLHADGVPILAGTDAGNPGTAHGVSLHDELALLVDAGLTPLEALAAATSIPARVFGLRDRGRIAESYRADLVLVKGDPTTDITATMNIVGIWHDGIAFDRESWARSVTAGL